MAHTMSLFRLGAARSTIPDAYDGTKPEHRRVPHRNRQAETAHVSNPIAVSLCQLGTPLQWVISSATQ